MTEITRDEFIAYEEVRESGVTNMFNLRLVSELSGLSRDKALQIMDEYEDLMKKYPGVRGNTTPVIGIVNLKKAMGGE